MLHESQRTILSIDDSPEKLELMSFMLRKTGYRVMTAFDGREGFEAARRVAPDLIISDVCMPGMDGIELCRRIRADHTLCATPVMLVTALSKGTASLLEGLEAGADDYLEAPYDPMRLIAMATRLIERKGMEDALRNREKYYRTLIENATDLISILNADGSVQYESPSLERILGYDAEDLIAKNVFEFIHPADVSRARHALEEALEKPVRAVEVELRFRHKNGSWRYFICRLTNLIDDSSIRGMVSNAFDNTKQKEAEEALRAQEEFQRALLRSFPNGSVNVFDRDFRYILAEGVELERFGLVSQQLVGRTLAELLPKDAVDYVTPFYQRVFAGEEVEFELGTTGQTYNIHAVPLRDANGYIHAVLAVAQNITARKRINQENETLAAIVESSEDAIVGRTLDGVITSWNRGAELMYGYAKHEAVGRHVSLIVPPSLLRSLDEDIRRVGSGEKITHYETQRLRKDGLLIDVSISGSPIVSADGQILGASTIARDISERKFAERRLKAYSEQLRALAARLESAREEEGIRIAREIHDELGGALTGIRWDLESIDRTLATLEIDASARVRILSKIKAMNGLLDSSLHMLKRISSELRPPALEDLGLKAAIELHVQQFQTRTNITCRCHPLTDFEDLSRKRAVAVYCILQEALTNVLRHAHATRVDISLVQEDGKLVLRIRDNGKGISHEESTAANSLGLLGMQERAHLVGGAVTLNGAPGVGTTVTVRIPLKGNANVAQLKDYQSARRNGANAS